MHAALPLTLCRESQCLLTLTVTTNPAATAVLHMNQVNKASKPHAANRSQLQHGCLRLAAADVAVLALRARAVLLVVPCSMRMSAVATASRVLLSGLMTGTE